MTMNVSLTYYDRILGGIAASLLAGVVLGMVGEWGFYVGMLGGALVATLFVYLALFRNPPLPETSTTVKTGAVVWHAFLALLLLAAHL